MHACIYAEMMCGVDASAHCVDVCLYRFRKPEVLSASRPSLCQLVCLLLEEVMSQLIKAGDNIQSTNQVQFRYPQLDLVEDVSQHSISFVDLIHCISGVFDQIHGQSSVEQINYLS